MDTNDPDCHRTFEGSIGYEMPKGKNNIISTIYNEKSASKFLLKLPHYF